MRRFRRNSAGAGAVSTSDMIKEDVMKYRAAGAACLAVALAAASPAFARGGGDGGGGNGNFGGRSLHGSSFARGSVRGRAAHFAGRRFRSGYVDGYGRGYYGGNGYDSYAFAPPDVGSSAYACGYRPYSSCYYGW